MTATPIPRTLALTLYRRSGCLRNRPVTARTQAHPDQTRQRRDHVEQVYSFLRKQIDLGRQAYVVYPVIEESETQAMKAAQKMHEHPVGGSVSGRAGGLLHGKLPA